MLKSIRSAAVALMLAVTMATSACSSWLTNFKNDPTAAIASFLQQVSAYIAAAEAIFNVIAPLLSADKQATARADFAKAVATADHAIQALTDAENAAVAAGNSTPDFTAVTNAVVDAVNQIEAIVEQYQTPPAGAAAIIPPGMDTLKASQAAIDKYKR